MFTDGRSKQVIFLAHCLLNQNAISDGTAVYPAAFLEAIAQRLEAVGIAVPMLGLKGADDSPKKVAALLP